MWALQGNLFTSQNLSFQATVYFEDKASFILRNFIWVRNYCYHFADETAEAENQQITVAQIS